MCPSAAVSHHTIKRPGSVLLDTTMKVDHRKVPVRPIKKQPGAGWWELTVLTDKPEQISADKVSAHSPTLLPGWEPRGCREKPPFPGLRLSN